MTASVRRIPLCRIEQIEDGRARGFDPFNEGRDLLFVVRRGKSVKGYLNRCPHQQASLPWRRNAYLNAEGNRIVCSAHGAQFDIDSGQCTLGPALGRSLVPVTINAADNGELQAQLPAECEPAISTKQTDIQT